MNTSRIALYAFLFLFSTIAHAGLTDEVRADAVTILYHSCLSSKPPTNTPEYLAMRPRLCICGAERIIDAGTAAFEEEKNSIDQTQINEIREWCLQHQAEFEDKPPSPRLAKLKKTNDSVLFNGKTHRFTAFRQHIFSKDNQLVNTIELKNNEHLLDFQVAPDKSSASIFDVGIGQRYELVPLSGAPRDIYGQSIINHDWAFLMLNGKLDFTLIDSKRNLMAVHTTHVEDGSKRVTHFVRSQALMCDALREARTRAIQSAAISIFKEVLIAAIRSYAGASYSGGNFTAYTTSGQLVTGTYSRYDPSWLGEHYSRGLDAVFQGTASLVDINRELTRLECDSR